MVAARVSPILGLLLCVFLAPVVAHANAVLNGGDEVDWIRGLSGLHDWADSLAPGDVYCCSFGLVTPLIYALLLLGLWPGSLSMSASSQKIEDAKDRRCRSAPASGVPTGVLICSLRS